VVSAILALARLQKASQYYTEKHLMIAKEFDDAELLEKLARYAVFAAAVYGWKMDLAMRGRLHLGGDPQALLKATGIKEEDVIEDFPLHQSVSWHHCKWLTTTDRETAELRQSRVSASGL
jgi:hypothetical protein